MAGTEIEIKNLGEKTGIKLIADDQGKVVIATEESVPLQPTMPDGKLDEFAIHDNEAAEFSPLTEKGAPASTDLVMIEDSEAGFAKKKVQVGNIGGGGSSSFLGLSDTPNAYDGAQAKLVAVKDIVTPDGLEFIDPATLPVASHAHTESDITDLGAYLDQTAADLLYAAVGHDHSGVYSEPGHAHVEADITDLDHTDGDAVHLSVDDEFSGLTQKAAPVAADKVLLEDSEAAGAKKWAPFSAFGGGGGGSTAFDIPHNSPWDGTDLKVITHGLTVMGSVWNSEVFTVAAGSFIRAFEHGTDRTGTEPGEEFTKFNPPQVCISRDQGVTWSLWSSNVWVPSVTFDMSVDAGMQHLIHIAAYDGWTTSIGETWVVVGNVDNLPYPTSWPS